MSSDDEYSGDVSDIEDQELITSDTKEKIVDYMNEVYKEMLDDTKGTLLEEPMQRIVLQEFFDFIFNTGYIKLD